MFRYTRHMEKKKNHKSTRNVLPSPPPSLILHPHVHPPLESSKRRRKQRVSLPFRSFSLSLQFRGNSSGTISLLSTSFSPVVRSFVYTSSRHSTCTRHTQKTERNKRTKSNHENRESIERREDSGEPPSQT